jgi:hypothetical protein
MTDQEVFALDLGDGNVVKVDAPPERIKAAIRHIEATMKSGKSPSEAVRDPEYVRHLMTYRAWMGEQDRRYPFPLGGGER